MNTRDRARELLALNRYQASQIPSRTEQPDTTVIGYDAVSGRIQSQRNDGAIIEATPAVITDLGVGDIGAFSGESFV